MFGPPVTATTTSYAPPGAPPPGAYPPPPGAYPPPPGAYPPPGAFPPPPQYGGPGPAYPGSPAPGMPMPMQGGPGMPMQGGLGPSVTRIPMGRRLKCEAWVFIVIAIIFFWPAAFIPCCIPGCYDDVYEDVIMMPGAVTAMPMQVRY